MDVREHRDYVRLSKILVRTRGDLVAWAGTCFRFATPRFSDSQSVVNGLGAFRYGSRWIAAGVAAAVHGSTRPELAFAESLANHRRANIPEWQAMPLIVCAVRAELRRVLDLTDGRRRRLLHLSSARLLGDDWRAENAVGRESISQALGRAAFMDGTIEGLLVASATGEPGANLVVFPERLSGASCLNVLRSVM